MTTELEEAKARLARFLAHGAAPIIGTDEHKRFTRDLRTLLSAVDGDGWRLLPTEATPDMCAAFYDLTRAQETLAVAASDAYRAMIAAAPPVPEGGE